MSSELIAKIGEILEKAELPERHTFFQIEKFIIGKEVTAQGQMWQIVRELKARKETVDSYTEQLENAEDDLDLINIELKKLKKRHENEFDILTSDEIGIHIRKLERKKKRLNNSIENVRKKVKYVLEESRYLISAFEKIEEIEKFKPIDDREAQIEFWNEKFLEEFNLRVLLQNPLDTEFVKTVMALNDDSPVKKHVTSILNNVQKSMMIKNEEMLKRLEKQSGKE